MKIGLVRRGYSATGGAEAYLTRLAGALFRMGHELVLFSDRHWPDSSFAAEQIQLTRSVIEASSPGMFADGVRDGQRRHECDSVLSLERIWACDAYRAGDGVHAAWMDRRREFEPRWRSALRWLNAKHRQILELERALFSGGAGCVIANSKMVKREIEERFAYPAERIHVIYNGVPPVAVPPGSREAVRLELGLDPQALVALFVGSGWERKGLRFAVEAMNAISLPQATLLVAGRGRESSMPRSARVRFLGPSGDIPRLLAAADVFVLPTLYEPFSNACLEALAAGLPVITTRYNGFAEIIEHGVESEVIGEPRDVEAIARGIEAWAPRERRDAVRPRLLELGARFSIEENVRRTLKVIERVLGK